MREAARDFPPLRFCCPTDTPQNTDIDIWNPDGSRTDISLSAIATLFAAAVALTDTDHAIVEG